MKYVILLIPLLFIANQEISSQKIKNFSSDPKEFIVQFEEFMTKNITKEDSKYLDDFIEGWESDSVFYEGKRETIIEICNLWLQLKSRPFPDFKNYLDVLIYFRDHPSKMKYYKNWNESIIFLMQNNDITRTQINKYLDFTPDLLEYGIIYKSSYVEWKASSNDFELMLKNNRILIKFSDISLVCYSKRDSINLYETGGIVDPVENFFYGEKGLVTWERAGYDRDNVFAILDTFKIDLTRSEYKATNVSFTNKYYFDKPLLGDFEDAVRLIKQPESATYPRFKSYTKLFELQNIYDDVDYIGGLTMQGANLVGSGTAEQKAKLSLYSNDTLFMIASSEYFAFTKDKLTGRNTEITIYLKQDSIYHPDLLLTYTINNKELSLLRTEDYTSQSPYFNSYHMVDMNFEQLIWRHGEPFISFTMSRGSTIGNANFESANFFNMKRFEEIQLHDPEHPLVQLKRYSRIIKSNKFTGNEYADFLRLPVHQVRQLLMRMSFLGFIFYNFETDEVIVKDKLQAYLDASINRIDYDVIDFRSVTNAPLENAQLDLKSFDLTINGMPQVFISDSQNVNIFPSDSRIILKRNRSFQFNGTVEAGLFTFWGNNFYFNYDSFSINLQNIDSIHMKFITGKKDNYGFDIYGDVSSMIEHVTGIVYVDKPDNKSGREHRPEYPIFESHEGSYVYYDDKSTQNGVYKRSDFYFSMLPFTIDSLDNFSAKGLAFDGSFESANIFPTFDETLRLQEDQSLGFKNKTDSIYGKPLYGGKGVFKNIIHLSNAGLKGNGTVEYLTSVTKSDNFIFLPDSMNGHAQEFRIAQQKTGTQYPLLRSKNNYIHWEPYNDNWMTYQEGGPFIIYNDTTTLAGSVNLKPTGLTGSGKLDMTRAVMETNNYKFLAEEFDAQNASFELRSKLKGISINTDSVNINIDYPARKGKFESVRDYSVVNFPENRYVSHIDEFTWNMSKREVEFTRKKGLPESDDPEYFKGATYISTDPAQDSLEFKSPLTVLNYEKNILNAQNVKYFDVADSRIYPKDEDVTIQSNGKMKTLADAKSFANRNTRFHQFYKSVLTVNGKNDYQGFGFVNYADENKKEYPVYYKNIHVDSTLQTVAEATILEPDSFKISPYFDFQGKIKLYANQKFYDFDGGIKVLHSCETIEPRWLKFSTTINPDTVLIPLTPKMKDINGNYIFAGTMIRSDSIHIYPAFFNVWENYSDNPIITAEGYLYFDKGPGRFKISSLDKKDDFTLPGNYLSLQRTVCDLYGEGKIDLNTDLGQVKISTVGNSRHDALENELRLNVLLTVDFHIPQNIMMLTGKEIDSIPYLQPVDLNSNTIKKGYTEMLGTQNAANFYEELGLYGFVADIPQEFIHTLFINDLKLVWNRESRSYQSVGKIGIGSVLNRQINKYVEGFIEIDRKRSGDKMDIFLKLDDRTWYYFGYTRGVMQVLSSNKNFVNSIRYLKKKERVTKIKGEKTPYNIIVSTDRKYLLFIERWNEVLNEQQIKGIK